jgi:hypothetical protein
MNTTAAVNHYRTGGIMTLISKYAITEFGRKPVALIGTLIFKNKFGSVKT